MAINTIMSEFTFYKTLYINVLPFFQSKNEIALIFTWWYYLFQRRTYF